MNFADPNLVEKYGSWMRVQVAFYDFLFEYSMNMGTSHFNQELSASDFQDGEAFYEQAIEIIEQAFESPEQAWRSFIEQSDL